LYLREIKFVNKLYFNNSNNNNNKMLRIYL